MIFKVDMVCISDIRISEDKLAAWKYQFELKTKSRSYTLFAPTAEERDLWVNGFKRIYGVPV